MHIDNHRVIAAILGAESKGKGDKALCRLTPRESISRKLGHFDLVLLWLSYGRALISYTM